MRFTHFYLSVCILFFLIACERNNGGTTEIAQDCDLLTSGLLNYDKETVATELSKILSNLPPEISESDPIGHQSNLTILISRISECDDLEAEQLCYACIETYPPQSEIVVAIDSAEMKVFRVIDVLTPEDSFMTVRSIHRFSNAGIQYKETNYKGCFTNTEPGTSEYNQELEGELSYEISEDTLHLHALLSYNCCAELVDSIDINSEEVSIYIADTCSGNHCTCRCLCNFVFEYKFTNFWQRNIHFKVFVREYEAYELWQEKTHYGAPD